MHLYRRRRFSFLLSSVHSPRHGAINLPIATTYTPRHAETHTHPSSSFAYLRRIWLFGTPPAVFRVRPELARMNPVFNDFKR